jgi:hypothetical protein
MRAALIGLVTGGACLALWSAPALAYERPWLGVYVVPAEVPHIGPDSRRWRGGARVLRIEGPAVSAGLHPLDVVVEVDGQSIADSHDLVCRIAAQVPGKSIRLTLVRGHQQVTVTATLGRWPDREKAGRPPPGCVGTDAVSDAGHPTPPSLAGARPASLSRSGWYAG